MHKLALSVIAGFILIYIQSLMVMKWNGYSSIEFHNLSLLFSLWAVNVIMVYSLVFNFRKPFRESDNQHNY
ncbi:hypothetical protein [Ammoniphilus sp. 3BR4]|uniref:hypothetical protein n=1 Tax=Ammoniphilus sp. 3BR4 TaxID=3158265 RepID=UPI003464EC3F